MFACRVRRILTSQIRSNSGDWPVLRNVIFLGASEATFLGVPGALFWFAPFNAQAREALAARLGLLPL
jgi:hypothetical protein